MTRSLNFARFRRVGPNSGKLCKFGVAGLSSTNVENHVEVLTLSVEPSFRVVRYNFAKQRTVKASAVVTARQGMKFVGHLFYPVGEAFAQTWKSNAIASVLKGMFSARSPSVVCSRVASIASTLALGSSGMFFLSSAIRFIRSTFFGISKLTITLLPFETTVAPRTNPWSESATYVSIARRRSIGYFMTAVLPPGQLNRQCVLCDG